MAGRGAFYNLNQYWGLRLEHEISRVHAIIRNLPTDLTGDLPKRVYPIYHVQPLVSYRVS